MLGFDDFLDSPTAPLEYSGPTRAAKRTAGASFDAAAVWVRHAAGGAADGAASCAAAPVGLSLPSAGFHSPELLR